MSLALEAPEATVPMFCHVVPLSVLLVTVRMLLPPENAVYTPRRLLSESLLARGYVPLPMTAGAPERVLRLLRVLRTGAAITNLLRSNRTWNTRVKRDMMTIEMESDEDEQS